MRTVEQGIVAKFGGSSNANAERLRSTQEIVAENPDRRYVVLSAAGKRFPEDEKITNVLLQVNTLYEQGLPFEQAFENVTSRHEAMGRELNCHSSVVGWLSEVEKGIREGKGRDWTVSRGEWLMANIFVKFAGGILVDPEKIIKLQESGDIDQITYELIKEQLAQDSVYVIPGFYGEYNGSIKIFARGGSDITGAIIARGVGAKLYENWTDVDGVKSVDPRIIPNARTIPRLTYKEMRELGYRGAEILQMDSVLPVIELGIPINIKNSFNPEYPGTMIVSNRLIMDGETVVAIAGKSGYISLQIEKYGMNNVKGMAGAILEVFEQHDISFEHTPTGLDTMSVIFHEDQMKGKEEDVLQALRARIRPEDISVVKGIGLVCVVGEGIQNDPTGVHSKVYCELQKKGIQVLAESYTTRGNNIILAVNSDQVRGAIQSLYNSFVQ